jgi:RecJ-like exonuclease
MPQLLRGLGFGGGIWIPNRFHLQAKGAAVSCSPIELPCPTCTGKGQLECQFRVDHYRTYQCPECDGLGTIEAQCMYCRALAYVRDSNGELVCERHLEVEA